MVVFTDKVAFTTLGLEPISPSPIHTPTDCALCKDPLATHPSHTSTPNTKYHAAVRINACGHVIGQECLSIWLDVGHTCPTCNRLLFEPSSAAITQEDATYVVRSLSHVYSEHRVKGAVARLMVRKDAERVRLQRMHEVEMEKLRDKDTKAKKEELAMDWDDFVDSDGELDIGEDEEVADGDMFGDD
ncbi:hypothetical protein ACN47E_002124 [Coniothyrium glycines]